MGKTVIWVLSILGMVLALPTMFKRPRRRRKVRPVRYSSRRRRKTRSGKPIPRSVGTGKRKRAKQPWQVKGSEAARRHMAKLRKMR